MNFCPLKIRNFEWDFFKIFKQRALLFVRTDTIFQAPFCPKHDAKWANNIQFTFCATLLE